MLKAIEATIDTNGEVHLKEQVHIKTPCRAIVTIIDDTTEKSVDEITMLSEQALATDWNRPEEDEAWSHLQQAQ